MSTSAKETLVALWRKVPQWSHPWLVLAVAVAVCFVLAIARPAEGMLPRCPSRTVLGIFCPGCGSQRTIHALMHGRLLAALRINPLAVVAVPYLAISWLLWMLRTSGVTIREIFVPSKVLWGLLFVIVGMTIVRNIDPLNNAFGLVDLDDYSAGSATEFSH